MKTKMLELTIFKIGSLLQQGFGELGAKVVAKQLTQTDIGMDLTLPGKNVDIVFSVCRIKQFTDTTECMRDEIIVFVNKIVKIIHECTKQWDGMPTKNYGDKFLLTWKMPKIADAVDLIKAENDEDSSIKEPETPIDLERGSKKRAKNSRITPDPSADLKDSARDEKDTNTLLIGDNSDKVKLEGIGMDEDGFVGMTTQETHLKRAEIANKAVIAAVKTIAELARASDL
jgi:hypothetical protein